MDKTNRQRIKIILLLSLVTVILFGGILVNQFINNYINTSAPTTKPSVFLPPISKNQCIGTEIDDTFVDAFFVGDDTYVFYNSDSGIMQKDGVNPLTVKLEGQLKSVALTPHGFAVAIEKENVLSIKMIDFSGIPTVSISITLKNAELQYLGYDGNVCIAIRHQGDFDYVLSYFKYDDSLNETYRRDVYSLYNLSTVACYPLSNKTIIFFNAQYGSVKRGGYSIIYNNSLALETEYFTDLDNCTLYDAKPYKNGFIISATDNVGTYVITLDENMKQTINKISSDVFLSAKIYTDGKSCNLGLVKDNSIDLLDETGSVVVSDFADKIYDCIFIDGSPIFAIAKSNVTYIKHLSTGITSPIINTAPLSLTMKKNKKLTLFATLNTSSTSLISKGGMDVYCATLD